MKTFLEYIETPVRKTTEFWHGSPSGELTHGPIHVGSRTAAKEALESRIGVPAQGEWDGTREYGKTLLAGKKTLKNLDPKEYNVTGYNVSAPEHDYYPTKMPAFSDSTEVHPSHKPNLFKVNIVGSMRNTQDNPMTDTDANRQAFRAFYRKKDLSSGIYYKNDGEDEGSVSAVVPSAAHLKVVT